jgi:serine/threonine protein kinase/thiol-disulfide isomerase/thioredoxin
MPQQPKQIGQYQIRRLIASGGMGSVYAGQQQSPRRSVAIKVLNSEVSGSEGAGRLRYEAQLLARLRHPGIAEIYEAGTYEQDGKQLPFFAMEYIANAKSITGYAVEKGLSTRQRLELFAEVCDAVHHGHQRSIVHRDLKPANILVDSSGRVRIIDFGIARATDSDLKQTSIQTEVGLLVRSAAYMSPEQFEADPRDIDTRSDVYRLGVVLYELLAGIMPYDAKSKSIYEVALLIKDEKPPLLGTKSPDCKGEIETIVEKALHKDRDHRYKSASGLAEDIRRYLNGEAIAAKPLSMKYQAQVFARRNKAVVGLMAAVLVLLISGISITTSLYVNVSKERQRAEEESQSAKRARDFLTSALRTFAPPGYGVEPGVAEVCDRAALELDGAFPDAPETEAEVRMSLAEAYWRMHRYEDAESHFSKAIELRESAWGASQDYLAVSRRLVDLNEQHHGPLHEQTMSARLSLIHAQEMASGPNGALEPARNLMSLCLNQLGSDHEYTLSAEELYAQLLMAAGRSSESLDLARRVYDRALANFPEDDGWRENARSTLAASLLASGRQEEAKALYGHTKLPDRVDIEQSFQGAYTPHDSDITILVFWETWCPFSQRAVPKLDQIYRQYKEFGIDVVGITQVNRSATEETVRQFIEDKDLAIPIVKETGRIWNYFDCQGTPFVCVTHDDELVWKGYVNSAEEFSQQIIEGMLAQP